MLWHYGIPITIDKDTPIFTDSLRKMPETMMSYSHQLPVTTEIAREEGLEFSGYPKFIAEIEFTKEDTWITCELKPENQHTLTLSGQHLVEKIFPRFRVDPITYRNGYILRSALVMSERKMSSSKREDDAKIGLGEHPITEELRGMKLGKMLGYRYFSHVQGVLTPVIESFSGK